MSVSIRTLVKENIDKHLYDTALFWADKAASLSDGDIEDLFWLAQCYYYTAQYQRAIHMLSRHNFVRRNKCCLYLAVQCHIATKEYEDALALFEKSQTAIAEYLKTSSAEREAAFAPLKDIDSSLHLQRGVIAEALEDRPTAIASYTKALHANIYCMEAFDRLVAHHMLSGAQERELFESLPFERVCGPDASMVRALYASKMKKYEPLPPSVRDVVLPLNVQSNLDMIVSSAERLYYACNFRKSHELTARVLDEDPFHHDCLPIHIACQLELQDTNGLFYLGHKLVDSYPEKAVSWFATACYYMLTKNFAQARRYFGKATHLDATFGPGWLGFGHAFAIEGEHDQAMAAYCTASRLMPGCHLPLLCVGIEHMLTNNLRLAHQYMESARTVCSFDPLVLNELGVVRFREGQYNDAIAMLLQAKGRCEDIGEPLVCAKMWEAVLFNLGRAFQKLGDHQSAIAHLRQALVISPHTASAHAALAYSHQCIGNLDQAVLGYHNALALDADDVFSASMLRHAMTELVLHLDDDDVAFDPSGFTDMSTSSMNYEPMAMADAPVFSQDLSFEMG